MFHFFPGQDVFLTSLRRHKNPNIWTQPTKINFLPNDFTTTTTTSTRSKMDNFLDNFDLGLLSQDTGSSSDVAFMQIVEGPAGVGQHQTLAERMKGDKQETLSSMR